MASNGTTHELTPMGGASRNGKQLAPAPAKSVSTSSGPLQQREKLVGEWLCADGPYREYIEALSRSNPGLKHPDPNNKKRPLRDGNALVVLLDAPVGGVPKFHKTAFKNVSDLRNHLKQTPKDHDRRRIYMMEGLAPDYIAAIGEHFRMEPTFFQRQERTCVWSNDFTPVSDALPHPSLLDPERSFHLQYCELRQFNKSIENRYYFCHRTGRHVGMTASRFKEETTTGILRRKVSWWCRTTGQNGWDVVLLCDPELCTLSPKPKEVVFKRGEVRTVKTKGNKTTTAETKQDQHEGPFIESRLTDLKDAILLNDPFQDGYVDFLPPPSYEEIKTKEPHPHKSMLADLTHYYLQHSDRLSEEDWETPNMSAVFLKKIVAAHYLQLVDYIKVMLPSLELRLTTAWVEEQDQWKSLQTISRRCGNYRDDIEDTLISLGYPLDGKLDVLSSGRVANWKDCTKDFQYAYFRLKILKERADNLMQAMTGLASIAGNRQNLEEAKRVKRLNLLALLFIPLAYTSSLFSMQDNYAPNKGEFWVYWVSAIGVVLFTAVITWVLDTALDEEAQWTWRPLMFFKFWGKKDTTVYPVKRGTSFYKLAKS